MVLWVEKRAEDTKFFHMQATTKRNIVQSIVIAGMVHDGERGPCGLPHSSVQRIKVVRPTLRGIEFNQIGEVDEMARS